MVFPLLSLCVDPQCSLDILRRKPSASSAMPLSLSLDLPYMLSSSIYFSNQTRNSANWFSRNRNRFLYFCIFPGSQTIRIHLKAAEELSDREEEFYLGTVGCLFPNNENKRGLIAKRAIIVCMDIIIVEVFYKTLLNRESTTRDLNGWEWHLDFQNNFGPPPPLFFRTILISVQSK